MIILGWAKMRTPIRNPKLKSKFRAFYVILIWRYVYACFHTGPQSTSVSQVYLVIPVGPIPVGSSRLRAGLAVCLQVHRKARPVLLRYDAHRHKAVPRVRADRRRSDCPALPAGAHSSTPLPFLLPFDGLSSAISGVCIGVIRFRMFVDDRFLPYLSVSCWYG